MHSYARVRSEPPVSFQAGSALKRPHTADRIITGADGRQHAFIPEGFDLKDISDPNRLPEHISQAVILDDRESLTNYVNRFSDGRSILIADYDAGLIRAHLDWHNDNSTDLQRQHASHTATLKLRNSEEYDRWNKMEGEMHSQESFALFIEENVADISDPDHLVMLEICRDLEATQDVSFKSGIRLENGDRTFVYEDETKVKGDMTVPTEIGLCIPLYQGEEPTDIRAKFRFRPTASGLMLGFRWHRVEYMRQATFAAMAHQTAENTGRPYYFGRTS
ncbi:MULTISPECIES: DUF2303 family protein [Leisingera]|uniref:DUF2303 family protein n=1 Tax=Leisingera TaxID=191028 RepID=UPI001FD405C9|nr:MULTISPECIES: DUF2303 family protein [Leisingera]